jgi:glycosyltransferase involved in cell wall biosynthesis
MVLWSVVPWSEVLPHYFFGCSLSAYMPSNHGYILVTPTKNEEAHIGSTLDSVVNQTVRPRQWVIVNDGSTDGTTAIVQAAAEKHPWIVHLILPARADRNFAAVVHATEAGLRALQVTDYAFVGLLDSDVRFDSGYFAGVIQEFASSPRLGLAGGVVIDVGLPRDLLPLNLQDIPGAVQFFRRECFECLGGLVAIPEGGWDALTCVRARMLGYETRLLTTLVVDHLKPRNIAEGGIFRRKWQMGFRDYALGNHPVFEAFKCLGLLFRPPFLLGGMAWWLGFCVASLRRRNRGISSELVYFIRREQVARVREALGLSS